MEIASAVFPWLWRVDSSGTQKGGRPPFGNGTSGLVKGQEAKTTECVCSVLQTDCVK
jgi:hypothetical protein